jgi:hypothetical protein
MEITIFSFTNHIPEKLQTLSSPMHHHIGLVVFAHSKYVTGFTGPAARGLIRHDDLHCSAGTVPYGKVRRRFQLCEMLEPRMETAPFQPCNAHKHAWIWLAELSDGRSPSRPGPPGASAITATLNEKIQRFKLEPCWHVHARDMKPLRPVRKYADRGAIFKKTWPGLLPVLACVRSWNPPQTRQCGPESGCGTTRSRSARRADPQGPTAARA